MNTQFIFPTNIVEIYNENSIDKQKLKNWGNELVRFNSSFIDKRYALLLKECPQNKQKEYTKMIKKECHETLILKKSYMYNERFGVAIYTLATKSNKQFNSILKETLSSSTIYDEFAVIFEINDETYIDSFPSIYAFALQKSLFNDISININKNSYICKLNYKGLKAYHNYRQIRKGIEESICLQCHDSIYEMAGN